jgi:hypothetical protein
MAAERMRLSLRLQELVMVRANTIPVRGGDSGEVECESQEFSTLKTVLRGTLEEASK